MSDLTSIDSLGNDDEVAKIVRGFPVYEIETLTFQRAPHSDCLVVRYEGQVSTVNIAGRWLEDLDGALSKTGLDQILWDSRAAKGHPPEVRDRIWEWLEQARVLKRSAILVQSEMLRLSANLGSIGGKPVVRAFREFHDAIAWLKRK